MQEESGSNREPHAEDVHLDSAGGAVLPLEVHQLVVRLEDGHEALPGGRGGYSEMEDRDDDGYS